MDALSAAGLPVIEATAFVSPKAIPQLADGEDVFRRIAKRPGVRYPVLVPNEKGLDRAEAAGAREIAVFTAASETFNREEHQRLDRGVVHALRARARRARAAAGMRVRGYVSCAFGCPYEGRGLAGRRRARRARGSLDDRVRRGLRRRHDRRRRPDAGARGRRAHASTAGVPLERLALHFHDTRGTALANVAEGLREGVRIFDSSAGGLGGCPYAPGRRGQRRDGGPPLSSARDGLRDGRGPRGLVAGASRGLVAARSGGVPSSRVFQALEAAGGPRPV